MNWRVAIAALCVVSAGAAMSGCAADGSSTDPAGGSSTALTGGFSTARTEGHQQCLAGANTKVERSDCSFAYQKQMQGGRGGR
jgi:hypothetical protein